MAAVSSVAPARQKSGIDLAGNDICKALSIWAYYEATGDCILSAEDSPRE